jgi:hypothetical protein
MIQAEKRYYFIISLWKSIVEEVKELKITKHIKRCGKRWQSQGVVIL